MGRYSKLIPLVWIGAAAVLGAGGPPPADPLDRMEQAMTRAVARVRRCAVEVKYQVQRGTRTETRIASGVVIDDQGGVVSVGIAPSPEKPAVQVIDSDGRPFHASWYGADPRTGLTLLATTGLHAPAIRMAREPVEPGQVIFVVCNPFGLAQSVGFGHVSGIDRVVVVGQQPLCGLVQFDAPIHPGDNGAPVANLRGELVGIVRSCLTYRDPLGGDLRASDIGFAVPAAEVRWIVDQLRRYHEVRRGYLGLVGSGRSDPSPGAGAVISRVQPGSPAERAGIRPAERIIALDGHPIRGFTDLIRWMDTVGPDVSVRLTVARGRATRTVDLRTAWRPEPPAPSLRTAPIERREPTDRERKIGEQIDRLKFQVEQLQEQLGLPPDPALDGAARPPR